MQHVCASTLNIFKCCMLNIISLHESLISAVNDFAHCKTKELLNKGIKKTKEANTDS
jgi:hypothetical protein